MASIRAEIARIVGENLPVYINYPRGGTVRIGSAWGYWWNTCKTEDIKTRLAALPSGAGIDAFKAAVTEKDE